MARLKTVYPAHPVSGDVEGNLARVRAIVRKLHFMPGVMPVAPYVADCGILDDSILEEREMGMKTAEEYFRRGMIDEVWLYGPKISNGMKGEILLAWDYGLPVVAMTQETDLYLDRLSGYPDYADHREVILRRVYRLGQVPLRVLEFNIMRTHPQIDVRGTVSNMLCYKWLQHDAIGMLDLADFGHVHMDSLHKRFDK